jgi:hypothetical protein
MNKRCISIPYTRNTSFIILLILTFQLLQQYLLLNILAVPTLVPRSEPIPLAYASGYGFQISRDAGQD